MKTGVKFVKVKKDEEAVVTQPVPTPLPAAEPDSRDGVPEIKTESGGIGVKVRGVPNKVRPVTGYTNEEDSDSVPESPFETVSQSPGKRKPGRPPGSGKKSGSASSVPKVDKQAAVISSIARQVEGIHAMIDIAIPGMAITQAESMIMAEAMHGVMVAYGVKLDDKITSLLTLAGVVGIVEAPKIPLMMKVIEQRRIANQMKKQQRQVQTVRQIQTLGDPIMTQYQQPAKQEYPTDGGNSLFSHVTNEIAVGGPNE